MLNFGSSYKYHLKISPKPVVILLNGSPRFLSSQRKELSGEADNLITSSFEKLNIHFKDRIESSTQKAERSPVILHCEMCRPFL